MRWPFESFVNSEESKTEIKNCGMCDGLRALLIQKRVKRPASLSWSPLCLRALLIQKRVKPCPLYPSLFQV